MVEPVNLREFRKRKQRLEKEEQADRNRKFYGVSSKLKKQAKAQNSAEVKRLDGKRFKPDEKC
ncbi:MAG: DUF4169 family protein [Pseudomonadota bacterium]